MKKNRVFGFIIVILALLCSFLILYSYQKETPNQMVIEKPLDLERLLIN